MKDLIKNAICDTMLRLCERMDFNKITVTYLCRECGISKQTFYNHFHDKYDAAAWFFLRDTPRTKPINYQNLLRTHNNLLQHRSFYIAAMKFDPQNSLMKYMIQYTYEYYRDRMVAVKGEALTAEEDFRLRYNAYGSTGYIYGWLAGECKEKLEEVTKHVLFALETFHLND